MVSYSLSGGQDKMTLKQSSFRKKEKEKEKGVPQYLNWS